VALLSDTYKWLFDGVGGVAAVTLIGFLFKRLLKSFLQPAGQSPVILNSENSSSSPIASGSGINQNVNAPTINVHLGRQQSEPNSPSPRALPNIVLTGGRRVMRVQEHGSGIWCEDDTGYEAIVLQFSNEARADRRNSRAVVTASLVFYVAENELCRSTGGWLNKQNNRAIFEVNETNTLVVMMRREDDLETIAKRRVRHRSLRQNINEVVSENTKLPIFDCGTVHVCLTSAHSVLYQHQFLIRTRPLKIIPQ
jgi:hypothetical protein